MERLEFGFSDHSQDKAPRQTRTKRKWREIESLKEKYRLKRELQDLDFGLGIGVDDLDL